LHHSPAAGGYRDPAGGVQAGRGDGARGLIARLPVDPSARPRWSPRAGGPLRSITTLIAIEELAAAVDPGLVYDYDLLGTEDGQAVRGVHRRRGEGAVNPSADGTQAVR
jgi:hypothetical protein